MSDVDTPCPRRTEGAAGDESGARPQRVMLAVLEMKASCLRRPVTDRAESIRPFASIVLSILGPFAGARRLSRWLRYASFGMTALRIARDWRRPR
jgi:hypothetical protein